MSVNCFCKLIFIRVLTTLGLSFLGLYPSICLSLSKAHVKVLASAGLARTS